MNTSEEKIKQTLSTIISYYKQNGRSFPWRETDDPFHILVSEYMLQQTQTDRVVPKYISFLCTFPTVHALADAPRRHVLAKWSGLGYNRRAAALHDAAKHIVSEHDGVVPDDFDALCRLPGVGPYTAGAVLAFACNREVTVVETNIRTVVLHCFNLKGDTVDDRMISRFVGKLLVAARSRGIQPAVFYAALMDYGAHLKRSGISLNSRSKNYGKQKPFAGSVRQARGELIRQFLKNGRLSQKAITALRLTHTDEALGGLVKDGLIKKKYTYYQLSE